MTSPLALIKHRLQRRRLDGLLVTQPENRFYLSGYSGHDGSIGETAGMLLILQKGPPLLLTDSRFRIQATRQAKGFEVVIYKGGFLRTLKTLLTARGIRRLAVEGHYLLYSTALSLEKMLRSSGCEMVSETSLVEKLRVAKQADEIAAISRAVVLNEQVFQAVYATLASGMTEKTVAARIEAKMLEMGAEGPSFPTIVASGPNGALPHAVPSERQLASGEPIVIDMGLIVDGYCSDMTRTVVLGKMDTLTRDRFRLVRQAQLAAMGSIRAGAVAREVDLAARKVISDAGLGQYFDHSLGHGVGLAVHEAPGLNPRNRKKLQAGMVVTVEPGIYLEGWGGIRLENMVVVEENGCRDLNRDTTFLDV